MNRLRIFHTQSFHLILCTTSLSQNICFQIQSDEKKKNNKKIDQNNILYVQNKVNICIWIIQTTAIFGFSSSE